MLDKKDGNRGKAGKEGIDVFFPGSSSFRLAYGPVRL
jgi:hypothetical protein